MEDMQIIKEALVLYAERERNAVADAIDKAPPLSNEFFEKMDQRIVGITTKLSRAHNFRKKMVILIVAILTVFLCVACVTAKRIEIGGFLAELFDGHIRLDNDISDGNFIELDKVNIRYIPEDLQLTNNMAGFDWKMYEWKSIDRHLYISITVPKDGSIFIDTDDSSYEVITIGEITIHKTAYGNNAAFVWTDAKINYKLNCTNLTLEEVVKIIEGISYEEQ